ncbi:MAG: DUF5723 family protein [candidate division WOR-3 bacterium]
MIVFVLITLTIFNSTNFNTGSSLFRNPVTAIGFDAVINNPANLGLMQSPKYSLRLLTFEGSFVNTLLNLELYNKYFGTDSAIGNELKREFFSQVPEFGIQADGDLHLGALDFSYQKFGFAFRRVYLGAVRMPRELIDLILFGNELYRTYHLNNFSFDYMIYNSFNFAFALPVIQRKDRLGTIGIGLKFLLGEKAQITKQALGNFYSNEYFMDGKIDWIRTTASGGYGLGVDLGGTYDIGRYRFGLAILNCSPGIIWAKNLKTRQMLIMIDSFSVYRAVKTKSLDSVFKKQDTVFVIKSFRTLIPIYLTLGAGWKFDNSGSILSLVYEQNLVTTKFSTFVPKFSLDLKWNLLQAVIINPNIAIGGREGIAFALGLSKNIKRLLISVGLECMKSLSITKARGLKFGLSLGVIP